MKIVLGIVMSFMLMSNTALPIHEPLYVTAPTSAVVTAVVPVQDIDTYMDGSDVTVEPRLKYLSAVFTDMYIENGEAKCQGNFSIMGTRRVQLTVSLQESMSNTTAENAWSTIATASQSWNYSGTHVLTPTFDNLTAGRYYRTKTTATVYQYDNVTPVESVTVHSQIKRY